MDNKNIKTKKIISSIIKSIVFVLIFVVLFSVFVRVFHYKYNIRMEKYYELPKDSVDVLFVGSSHCYRNINPAILYNDVGYISYDLGSAGQYAWHSYYTLEEAVKTQSPKVVFVEIYKFGFQEEYSDRSVTLKSVCGKKFSKTFINEVIDSVGTNKQRLEIILGFPWYHTRYNELEELDYKPYNNNEYVRNYLGFDPLDEAEWYDDADWGELTEERLPLTDKENRYMEKFISLSKEKGFDLVFLVTPFPNVNNPIPYYNTIKDYANENGAHYLNTLSEMDKIGVDTSTDYGDTYHLTHVGANRLSHYLSKYISENYDIPDHRGESKYQLWQDSYNYFEEGGYISEEDEGTQ